LHDGDVHAGFYRLKARNGGIDQPIAYWFDKGQLRCRIGAKEIDEQTARERFMWAQERPITHELYSAVIEGALWPDVNEVVAGHNRAPADNSMDALADRLDDLAREAERMIKDGAASSEALCDQASDVANTLGEIEKRADAARTTEKQPHIDAGRAIDGKWRPLIERAADIKRRLKLIVVTPFLKAKEEERQKTLAAEIAKGTPADALPTVRTTAGSSKRSTALRTQKTAEITDYPALLSHLGEHPDIKDAVQRIANASARAGVVLPGMKITETKVAA
jgi:hypothetical protein